MKGFYKLYALISVGFISAVIVLASIYPSEFLNFVEALYQIFQNKQPIMDIYSTPMGTIETLYSYLMGLYVVNIIVNIVIWVLAYLSENKFYNRLVLYSLIINLVYFFIIYYTVKLIAESGFRTVRRFIIKR